MLPYALMGALALGILWVNTLLLCAATGLCIRGLKRRLRAYGELSSGGEGTGLVQVVVRAATEPNGALASQAVTQIGRYATADEDRILFHDASYESACSGGTVAWGERELTLAPTEQVEVWPSPERVVRAAECPSAEAFAAAYVEARRVQGFRRVVRSVLGTGHAIWVCGEIGTDEAGTPVIRPSGTDPLLLSEDDPRIWCRRRVLLLRLGQLGMLLGAAACTALALMPPIFGTVSTIGGALALLFFVLAQPFGRYLEELSRAPHERVVRGEWRKPG